MTYFFGCFFFNYMLMLQLHRGHDKALTVSTCAYQRVSVRDADGNNKTVVGDLTRTTCASVLKPAL